MNLPSQYPRLGTASPMACPLFVQKPAHPATMSRLTRTFSDLVASLGAMAKGGPPPAPLEVPANMDLFHSPRASRTLDRLRHAIRIDVETGTSEDAARAVHFDMALALTRQEDWGRLTDLIRLHDTRRSVTPGGRAATGLILEATHHDLLAGAAGSGDTEDLRRGLAAYEEMALEAPEDGIRALIAAEAAMALARRIARRDQRRRLGGQDGTWVRKAHDRAADLLARSPMPDAPSPADLLARARLALGSADLGGSTTDHLHKAIGLAPGYVEALTLLGRALLPGQNGDLARLPATAKRAMDQSARYWGRGGYAWVFMEVLVEEPATLAILDADLFLLGINDILDRHPHQYLANLWTSYLGVAMAPRTGWSALPPAAESVRARLHDHAGPLMRRHLRKLHPSLWHQSRGSERTPYAPNREQEAVRGADQAFWVIGRQFEKELAKGCTIVVSDRGWQLQRGA